MDERLRRARVQKDAAVKSRRRGDSAVECDNKVVNVASSTVTTPPMRSGPCSGMRGASKRCSWAKSTSGAWSSCTEAVEAKSMAN